MPCNALMWSHLVWQMKSQPCSDYSLLSDRLKLAAQRHSTILITLHLARLNTIHKKHTSFPLTSKEPAHTYWLQHALIEA